MKTLILLFIGLFAFPPSEDVNKLLKEFHSIKTESDELAFIKKHMATSSPTYQAYVCTMEMKQAEHTFNPMKKLSIFNKSKDKLELLVKENPKNIHLRYVRYLIQSNSPSMLSYKESMVDDKAILLKYLQSNSSEDLLSQYIKKHCSL